LDTALENQVLHGVKLGTCLVEMGYVSDDAVAKCLGKKTGHDFMSRDQLLAFGSQYLSVVTPASIKKHRIIPVGMQGGKLRIATDQEVSPRKQAELEKFLGRTIEPVAVSGYAVDYFLEQMFGIQRPGRFLSNYARVKTPENAPAVTENVNEEAAHVVIDGVEWKRLGDESLPEAHPLDNEAFFTATLNQDTVPLSLSEAATQLSQAKSRDNVAKTVLDYLSNSCETAALVIIKDGMVRGWKAYSNHKKLPEFEEFSSPLAIFPDLQQCVVTKKPYMGNIMSEETKLLLRKSHYAGGYSAFFPIFIQQRVIAVLLCDGSEKQNPAETAELCRKASYALEILVLRSKILSS
jgi:hypothetical protein